mmetsp:Transcript_20792/g.34409  ORF Transcript_20792/g.34409 Transcript_20792/m.34409 type:complete len:421 (-) Transcript_20792:1672-2934(-)|eukprot:CAMPEP_0203791324 /NCGR_PEP_ID=MMETSP0100_2-20121128/4564_1 /ASSEMBLY_ACC=CAM_ASM_000210 /TAXON_ID=96639 /ORGANISM=" , Strain NY0313808BC1" /LENGTH=420 /DNA_ID=CAMNT_0050694615 /DNA_START=43 /DNA_END=1305 /DNA_ORIENTATION=-
MHRGWFNLAFVWYLVASRCQGQSPLYYESMLSAKGLVKTWSCQGAACAGQIWCFENKRRPMFRLREALNRVVLSIEYNGQYAEGSTFGQQPKMCLLGDSSDSYFNVDTIRDFQKEYAVEERLNHKQGGAGREFASMLLTALRLQCPQNITFSPFGKSCVKVDGLVYDTPVTIKVYQHPSNLRYLVYFAFGYILLLTAPVLSEKLVFYYVSGVSLGVLLSIFIVTWFILKRVSPGKNSIYIAVAVQSLFGLVGFAGKLFQQAIERYPNYVLAYLGISVLASFAITHLYLRSTASGGGLNTGFKDLVRWSIQGLGYLLIFFSTPSTQLSVAALLGVFTYRVIFPILGRLGRFFAWGSGAKRLHVNYLSHRFITMDEYERVGKICTQNAKKELFRSPGFQKWAVQNADRIHVAPVEHRHDNDE